MVADGILLLLLLTVDVATKTSLCPLSDTNDDEKEELSCFTDTEDFTLVSRIVLVIFSSTLCSAVVVSEDINAAGVV